MRFFSFLHKTLGFTENEVKVIIFLTLTFLAGVAVRWYQSTRDRENGTDYDYTGQDSVFIERSRTLLEDPQEKGRANEETKPRGSPGRQSPAKHSINLNTASATELALLPGIGPAYAERIIRYRADHGPFGAIDDVTRVKGIGKKKLEAIRLYLTIDSLKTRESNLDSIP